MRVLIIEQESDGGHYLNSVRHLVQAFAPLGCDIVVAVPNTVPESAQFKIYLAPHQSRFQLEFIPSRDETMSRWRMILTQARDFRALIGRVKPDAVYVPTLAGYFSTRDGIAQSLAWWLALRARLSRLHCETLLLGSRLLMASGSAVRRLLRKWRFARYRLMLCIILIQSYSTGS